MFDDYHQLFERCIELAERNPRDRETLEAIAAQFLALAEETLKVRPASPIILITATNSK